MSLWSSFTHYTACIWCSDTSRSHGVICTELFLILFSLYIIYSWNSLHHWMKNAYHGNPFRRNLNCAYSKRIPHCIINYFIIFFLAPYFCLCSNVTYSDICFTLCLWKNMITLFNGWCYDWYIFPHLYAPILFLNENEHHTTITVIHTNSCQAGFIYERPRQRIKIVYRSLLHKQFTLLNLLQDFRHCGKLNRKCGGLKNGGWSFDCDEKILSHAHLSMRPAHPIIDPEKPPKPSGSMIPPGTKPSCSQSCNSRQGSNNKMLLKI